MSSANITISDDDICKTITCHPTIDCGGNYVDIAIFKDGEVAIQVKNPTQPDDQGLAVDMTKAEAATLAETILEAVSEPSWGKSTEEAARSMEAMGQAFASAGHGQKETA